MDSLSLPFQLSKLLRQAMFAVSIVVFVLCIQQRDMSVAESKDSSMLNNLIVLSEDKAAQVAGGADHTCALTESGGVKCWGSNEFGQLGNGRTEDRTRPVSVVGLKSNVLTIATGPNQSCAVMESGEARCWGLNEKGQLGDGTTDNRLTPVRVDGLERNIIATTFGYHHSCALTSKGKVMCWGQNDQGQLGNGTRVGSLTPVEVTDLDSKVTAISAGNSHTCALTDGGAVLCWGENFRGQLGSDLDTSITHPVLVVGAESEIRAIETGDSHTCALTDNGSVKCWGDNFYGQIGDGTAENRIEPIEVIGLPNNIVAIATGASSTCALSEEGEVLCWGDNGSGQIGDGTLAHRQSRFPDGTPVARPTPVSVLGLGSDAKAITGGMHHHCALMNDGGAKCWGRNFQGTLGTGTTYDRMEPVNVVGATTEIAAVEAGGHHTCALATGSGLQCWGANFYGEMGDGKRDYRWRPEDVLGLDSNVSAVTAGGNHTCALNRVGGVICWGKTYGGGGAFGYDLTPTDVDGLNRGVRAIAAGGYHTCALNDTGGVKCWGRNLHGEVGDGTREARLRPTDVRGLDGGIHSITVGTVHSCALTSAGAVKCWGDNSFGQVDGSDLVGDYSTPSDVSGLDQDVVAVAAGGFHTCALTTVGAVQCWGANYDGQLGDGTENNHSTPVDVIGLNSGVRAIKAGDGHTCALTDVGGVKCWGSNESGQLGDGSKEDRFTPVDIDQMAIGVVELAAGNSHTCALSDAGRVKCWGANHTGALGVNPGWQPQNVVSFGEASGGTVVIPPRSEYDLFLPLTFK